MNKAFEQIGREVLLQAWFDRKNMQKKTPMNIPRMEPVVCNAIIKAALDMGVPEPMLFDGEWVFPEVNP